MSDIQETINHLRELERAAHPAPWRWYDYYFEDWPECENDLTNDHIMIMHARNAIPALLAEIDRLTGPFNRAAAEIWEQAIEQAFLYDLSPEGYERRKEITNPYKENQK